MVPVAEGSNPSAHPKEDIVRICHALYSGHAPRPLRPSAVPIFRPRYGDENSMTCSLVDSLVRPQFRRLFSAFSRWRGGAFRPNRSGMQMAHSAYHLVQPTVSTGTDSSSASGWTANCVGKPRCFPLEVRIEKAVHAVRCNGRPPLDLSTTNARSQGLLLSTQKYFL